MIASTISVTSNIKTISSLSFPNKPSTEYIRNSENSIAKKQVIEL